MSRLFDSDNHRRRDARLRGIRAIPPPPRDFSLLHLKGPVSVFRSVKALLDTGCPVLPQLAVADFMREGHFERHLRKLRTQHSVVLL